MHRQKLHVLHLLTLSLPYHVMHPFRSQEEVSSLKRKLEKYKSREWAATSDEVLLEEIKTYKVRGRGMGDNEQMPKRVKCDMVGIQTQDLPVTSQKLLPLRVRCRVEPLLQPSRTPP